MADLPVVHIEGSGGQWVRPGEALFLDPSNKAPPQLLEALLRESIPLVCQCSLVVYLPIHCALVDVITHSWYADGAAISLHPNFLLPYLRQAFPSCLHRLGRACQGSCWRPACSACLARRS